MKNSILKLLALFILFTIFSNGDIFSQNIQDGEFMVVNQTGTYGKYIKIVIYPVGAIFSGGGQYTVDATHIVEGINRIYGIQKVLSFNQNEEWYTVANFDKTEERQGCKFPLGYGIYKVDFFEGPEQKGSFLFVDSCYVDFSDANFGTPSFPGYQQLRIDYYNSYNIKFKFIGPTGTEHNITEVGRHIKVWEQFGTGNPPSTPSKGMFNDTTLAQYHNFPIDASDFGAYDHKRPNDVYLNLKVKYQGANVKANNIMNFNDVSLTINEEITFTINNNQEMNISGTSGKLDTKQNSQIIFPQNFELNVKDYAGINATGTTFITPSGSIIWKGFRLDNPGNVYFTNCVFNNAEKALNSLNSNNYSTNISGCTFNIPSLQNAYPFGMEIINARNVMIDGNSFILPTVWPEVWLPVGLWIKKMSSGEEGPNYSMIIQNNNFYDGHLHIVLQGFLDNLLSAYLYKNYFGTARCNVASNEGYPDFKENIFNNNTSITGLYPSISIYSGYANFLDNTITSSVKCISGNSSNLNLAPLQDSQDELIWIGGKNKINSIYEKDIDIFMGYFYTDRGANEFTIQNPLSYHFYGVLDDTVDIYYTNGNCWYGNNGEPKIYLERLSGGEIPYVWEEDGIDCSTSYQSAGNIITEKGFGVNDTVALTLSSPSGQAPQDEKHLADGIKKQLLKDYENAILNFKNLINNYPESKFLNRALYHLYECHVNIDTTGIQSLRNYIFNQLKTYLLNKIQQYQSNNEFIDLAYDFVLKCNVKIKNYQQARDGYEFISLYNPIEVKRLNASWNYMLVNELMQGGSGGGKGSTKKRKQYDNPINDILLKSYRQIEKEKDKEYREKIINSENKKITIQMLDLKKQYEEEIKNIAYHNITVGRNLKGNRIQEKINNDYMKILNNQSVFGNFEINVDGKDNIVYYLSQNNPNPFNPVTTINYDLPNPDKLEITNYKLQISNKLQIPNTNDMKHYYIQKVWNFEH